MSWTKDDYFLPLFPHIEELGKVNVPLISDMPVTIDRVKKRISPSLVDRVKLLILNWNSRPIYKSVHLQYGMDFSKLYHMTIVQLTKSTGLLPSDVYSNFVFRDMKKWPRKHIITLIQKLCGYLDSGDPNIQHDPKFQKSAYELIDCLKPVECDALVRIFVRRKMKQDVHVHSNNDILSRKPKEQSHARYFRGHFLLAREKL